MILVIPNLSAFLFFSVSELGLSVIRYTVSLFIEFVSLNPILLRSSSKSERFTLNLPVTATCPLFIGLLLSENFSLSFISL